MESISEKNFMKVLEYSSLLGKNDLSLIAQRLSLQLFYETQAGVMYTIASTSFVIDVYAKSIRVYFVDDSLQNALCYVERYMNYYFARSDCKALYFVLRYLLRCEGAKSLCRATACGIVCECIFTEHPGVTHTFSELRKMDGYNIFTHRTGVLPVMPATTIAALHAGEVVKVEATVDGNKVVADKKGDVYVNGVRSAPITYLFKKGLGIKFCYDFIMK